MLFWTACHHMLSMSQCQVILSVMSHCFIYSASIANMASRVFEFFSLKTWLIVIEYGANRAGDWFLICIMLYIIWKLVICRTSSTINNYRIYIETREKGKNVLINSGDLIGHRDVTSRISAVYVRSTRWRKFRKEGGGGRTDPKLARYVHPGMAHASCKFRPRGVKIDPAGVNFVFQPYAL